MKTSDISDLIVCQAYREWQSGSGDRAAVDEILNRRFPDAPWKVINSAMERADRHGFVECGVSLRTGWLTERGEKLLGGETLRVRGGVDD